MTNYLIGLHGTIPQVSEEFVHTFAVTSPLTALGTATIVRDAWGTEWIKGATGMQSATGAGITYVKAQAAQILNIQGTPPPALGTAATAMFTPVLTAGGATFYAPQIALAVSFTAGAYGNGAAIKGRTFLPPPMSAQHDTGIASSTLTARAADNWSLFFAALKTSGVTPCVWSRGAPKHGSGVGQLSPIVSLRVGNKVDTIRSRRNDMVETYTSRTV